MEYAAGSVGEHVAGRGARAFREGAKDAGGVELNEEKESCVDCSEEKPCHYKCKRPKNEWKDNTNVVIHLDTLVMWCGWFTNDVETNNGYGCTHPKQEDTETNSEGKEEGRCFPFSCPIASELYPSKEPLNRGYFPDATKEELDRGDYDDGYMLVWDKFKD